MTRMATDQQKYHETATIAEIAELKKADRAELAAMPPEEAQAAVDEILRPHLWRVADPVSSPGPATWPMTKTTIESMSGFTAVDHLEAVRACE